jgi:hypothetical protein
MTRLSRRPLIWLHPHPLPHSPVRKLSLYLSLPVSHRSSLLTGEEGEGGGGGAKSYDGEKVWSSVNHSMLSGIQYPLAMGACILFSALRCENRIQTSYQRKNDGDTPICL